MTEALTARCCPVCQARFRGQSICSRCGADLKPVMFLIAAAYRCRASARQALLAGKFKQAETLVSQAEAACSTPIGSDLLLLSRWLVSLGSERHERSRRRVKKHRPVRRGSSNLVKLHRQILRAVDRLESALRRLPAASSRKKRKSRVAGRRKRTQESDGS